MIPSFFYDLYTSFSYVFHLQNGEEPEWIEVVVDLFLHLLSQNASVLRNIVDVLFPHLCNNLNLNAIHQILSMLDMKDGNNPLSAKGTEDEDDDDDKEQQDHESDSDAMEVDVS